jgi:acetyl-CoA acetyltransferase
MSMGVTSENVAEKYGITREQMDKMAVESHRKAAHA